MSVAVPRAVTPPQLIVALDYDDPRQALQLAEQLDPTRCRVKVGKQLFTHGGPDVVRSLHAQGHSVFLDLKFHDIPNTVAGACAAAAELGVWMTNLHVGGGMRMMARALDAVRDSTTLLIGVTVLTSLNEGDLYELGLDTSPDELVLRWAKLAHQAGLHGIVCSPADLVPVHRELPDSFLRVTPGVRPMGSGADDQRRVTTPAAALAAGASYLVVGRPITAAASPTRALADIADQCGL